MRMDVGGCSWSTDALCWAGPIQSKIRLSGGTDSVDKWVALPGMHVLDITVVHRSAIRHTGVSALLYQSVLDSGVVGVMLRLESLVEKDNRMQTILQSSFRQYCPFLFARACA